MGIFEFFRRKNKSKKTDSKEQKKLSFYELDETLFSLFVQTEKSGENFIDVLDVAHKLLNTAKIDNVSENEKRYAEAIVDYLDFLINKNEDKLNSAIDEFSNVIKKSIKTSHAHYFLGKAYYHKSFSSSDPLKYQTLSNFHLTEAIKKDKVLEEDKIISKLP